MPKPFPLPNIPNIKVKVCKVGQSVRWRIFFVIRKPSFRLTHRCQHDRSHFVSQHIWISLHDTIKDHPYPTGDFRGTFHQFPTFLFTLFRTHLDRLNFVANVSDGPCVGVSQNVWNRHSTLFRFNHCRYIDVMKYDIFPSKLVSLDIRMLGDSSCQACHEICRKGHLVILVPSNFSSPCHIDFY